MDLILWRHAEAEDGVPDMERRLTPKGHQQAAKIAAWLRPLLPGNPLVIASPAARAWQTADALGLEYRIEPTIAPGAHPDELLVAAGWPDSAGTTLLVGHQPTLGELAAHLLCSRGGGMSLKKGGLVWLSRRSRGDVVLRAAMTPDLA